MGGGEDSVERKPWWARPPVLVTSLVLLWSAHLAASYLQTDWAHNDFERFDDLRLTILFFGLSVGLCTAHVALYAARPPLARRTIWLTLLASAVLVLASFPVGSRDVFSYAMFGRVWATYHANPFVVAAAQFPDDPWHRWTSVSLNRPVAAYGPLFMWQSWPINAIAGDQLWLVVGLHKLVATLGFVASIGLVGDLLPRSNSVEYAPTWPLVLLAWNPLFLFETAGSAHNDSAMVVLLLATLWCWQRERFNLAVALLALSFWYKWYGIILVPALLIDTLRAAGLRRACERAGLGVAIGVAIGFVLLAPLPHALPTIVHELLHPEKMRGIFPTELPPPLAVLFYLIRATGWFEVDFGYQLFDALRFGLFGIAVALICRRQWRDAASFGALIEACALILLALCFLLITQLWPWHLLAPIALAIARGSAAWLVLAVVLTLLGLLSYFLTFGIATVLLAAVVSSVWVLRRARA